MQITIEYLWCETFNHSTIKGEVVDLIKTRDFTPYKNYKVKVCPYCGQYICDDENSKTECYTCKSSEMVVTPYSLEDMINFIESSDLTRSNTDIRYGWEERIRNQYCKQDNRYDKQLYDNRDAKEYAQFASNMACMKRDKIERKYAPNPNACPQCGCTQFAPVRRKWSFITGFMTNKIDMVCNQCGYVKKG